MLPRQLRLICNLMNQLQDLESFPLSCPGGKWCRSSAFVVFDDWCLNLRLDFHLLDVIHHGLREELDGLLEVSLHGHDHPDSCLCPLDILSDLSKNIKTGVRELLHQGSKFSADFVMIDWFALNKSSHCETNK